MSSSLTIKDYYSRLFGLVVNSSIVTNSWDFKVIPTAKHAGQIKAMNPPLQFNDGASLAFFEIIEINRSTNKIQRPKYSFQYINSKGDYFFRYERDKKRSYGENGEPVLDHPKCHLHAIQEEPRYMTHATHFEEIFNFIVACFYADE